MWGDHPISLDRVRTVEVKGALALLAGSDLGYHTQTIGTRF